MITQKNRISIFCTIIAPPPPVEHFKGTHMHHVRWNVCTPICIYLHPNEVHNYEPCGASMCSVSRRQIQVCIPFEPLKTTVQCLISKGVQKQTSCNFKVAKVVFGCMITPIKGRLSWGINSWFPPVFSDGNSYSHMNVRECESKCAIHQRKVLSVWKVDHQT